MLKTKQNSKNKQKQTKQKTKAAARFHLVRKPQPFTPITALRCEATMQDNNNTANTKQTHTQYKHKYTHIPNHECCQGSCRLCRGRRSSVPACCGARRPMTKSHALLLPTREVLSYKNVIKNNKTKQKQKQKNKTKKQTFRDKTPLQQIYIPLILSCAYYFIITLCIL